MIPVIITYPLQTRSVLYCLEKISSKEIIEILSFIFDLNITMIHKIVEITYNSLESVKDMPLMRLYITFYCSLTENQAGTMNYGFQIIQDG